MNFAKSFSKHIIIIITGILLACLVARIQYDTQDLSASVLSLTEQDFFKSTKWDAWYKKEKQNFEVFLSEQVRNEKELTISILSSPDLEWLTWEIKSPYNIQKLQENEWNIILAIDWYDKWDFSEWIFELPYKWDSKDITLEYIKSQNLNFAIWNLDNIENNQIH